MIINDIDGNGDNDIITTNEYKNNLTIIKHVGAGWAAPEYLQTGFSPRGIAVANVDSDPRKDIVVANYDENNVTVYEYDSGAPGWKAPYNLAVGFQPSDVVGNEPYALCVADMNKDTDLDILTANAAGADISILYWVENSLPTTLGIPDTYTMYEDTPTNTTFLDLWYYFQDAETPDNQLNYQVMNGSDDNLTGAISGNRFFYLTIGPSGQNWHGTRNFTVRAIDAGMSYVEDTFMITVLPVNDRPVIINVSKKAVIPNQDLLLTTVGFYAIEDTWWNRTVDCTLTFSTNITAGSPHPHERFFIDASNGTLYFHPNNDDALNGSLFFNLSVSDGHPGGVTWVRVMLGIVGVNDPPTIYPIGDPPGHLLAYEGVPFTYEVQGNDIDGDLITWSDDSPLFKISADGIISFTPTTQDIGFYSFNITARDPKDGNTTSQVELEIRNMNDPPDIPVILSPLDGGSFFTNENINFSAAPCYDPDIALGDVLTYIWDFGDGTSYPGRNQSHSYTSAGPYLVKLTVQDTGLMSKTVNVTITIKGQEDLPSDALLVKNYEDEQSDVNFFKLDKNKNTVGTHQNVDAKSLVTRREEMNMVISLTLYGTVADNMTYAVYVGSQFLENKYDFGDNNSLPTPHVPSAKDTYMYGMYYKNGNVSVGNPEVMGTNIVRFTLPVSMLIGKSDIKFFAIAYNNDNSTFMVDSVGDGKYEPVVVQPDDDDVKPESDRPWWWLPLIIGLVVLLIICVIAVVLIIVKNVKDKKKKKEEERSPPPPPPQDSAPAVAEPMGPSTPDMAPPPDLIPPEVPPPAPGIAPVPSQEVGPAEVRPLLGPGATPQQTMEVMLLQKPAQAKPDEKKLPELEPVSPVIELEVLKPERQGQAKGKGEDIFDDLFTPIQKGQQTPQTTPPLEVECYNCHGVILVTTTERPLVLKCPTCQTESMLQ